METCKSPRMVLLWAYHLGKQILPDYSSKFSRQDFTLPQLFACVSLREHQKKSYRGIEALLVDCPEWCTAIGMDGVPDHNTLWRAFKFIAKVGNMNEMLDLQAKWAVKCDLVQSKEKPASIDSSMFESHHVSRHFERRCKQTRQAQQRKQGNKHSKKQGDRRRSRTVKRLPKLSLAVSSKSHLVLAARATTGAGGDQPHFEPLLSDARRRANVKAVVADPGYDSEANHSIARDHLGVRSIIPPNTGRPRPDSRPPPKIQRHRRNMFHRFKRKADKKLYGQRWQSETVNSMIKRNLGSAMRARSARRRSMELMLRVVTHNLMIFRRPRRG
jgi:Transposase DDE domain